MMENLQNVIGEHASGRNEIEQMHIHPFKTILRDTIVKVDEKQMDP